MTRGCCAGCEGSGFSGDEAVPGGRCWDCRGTGHDHDAASPCQAVFTVNVGRCRLMGWQTLDELIAELQRLRDSGAPGDAKVHAAPIGSVNFAEVSWIGKEFVHTGPISVNHSVGCPLIAGTGPCTPCDRAVKLAASGRWR